MPLMSRERQGEQATATQLCFNSRHVPLPPFCRLLAFGCHVQYWAGYCSDADECPAAANGDSSPFAISVNGVNVTANNQLA